MEISDKTRQRLIELIRGKLAEMYQYTKPTQQKETDDNIYSHAEQNDEHAGDYIERYTKEILNDIENRSFARIINKKTSEIKAYPFIPDSHSDLSTLLGMLNKMKKKRKLDLHNNNSDPYLEALQDVREMARKIYRGDSDVTYDYQHKVCIICHMSFRAGSNFEFVDKKGYKHPQVEEYELTFPNAKSKTMTCKLDDYAE